ncbi:MAG: PQQ-dependent sugar dehydrogenase [Pseudomonadota bacterium]
MRLMITLAAAAGLAACAGDSTDANADANGPTMALESGLSLDLVADGLEFPWGMAVLPTGDLLVTEREGRLRIVRDGVLDPEPIAGTPEAYVDNQGGYLGLALDPEFATNRLVYMAYAAGDRDSNNTSVVRGRLSAGATALEDPEVIFESNVEKSGGAHFGGRLHFMPDGALLVTLGDGFRWMDQAQTLDNHFGKIVRIMPDGSIPGDNPFFNEDNADPAVWTYGHRNVQGIAYDAASGTLYAHEHGPKGGDELNVIAPGNNYGWPEITYGVNYDGTVISNKTAMEGMEQPVVKWVPSIAPSGMTLYQGDMFPEWKGDLLVGAMNGPAGRKLVRIDLDDDAEPVDLLTDAGQGWRDVIEAPDGSLYLATTDLEGAVYRLSAEQ